MNSRKNTQKTLFVALQYNIQTCVHTKVLMIKFLFPVIIFNTIFTNSHLKNFNNDVICSIDKYHSRIGVRYGSRKKVLLLMAVPLRGGGGVKGLAINEKRTFVGTFFSNVPKFQRPLSSRGEGEGG